VKQLVVAYVVLVVFAVAVAWLASQLRAVRRLDNRVLGERGIAAVAAVVASFLVVATVLTLARGVWAVAAVYAVMSGWVGYWTCRRFASLRRASR
jgi:hypothetical protein